MTAPATLAPDMMVGTKGSVTVEIDSADIRLSLCNELTGNE